MIHKLKLLSKTCDLTHHWLHLTYLGLVFFESHGMYGIAAGVLGVVVVVEGVVNKKITVLNVKEDEEN